MAFAILAITWTAALAYIETAGVPEINPQSGYVEYTKSPFWFWIRLYHLFGFLWLMNFFVACQHMVIAGAIAGWYFTRYYIRIEYVWILWKFTFTHLTTLSWNQFFYYFKKVQKCSFHGKVFGESEFLVLRTAIAYIHTYLEYKCVFCDYRDKSKLGLPILSSFGRLVRYHIGSVAFGSLIIALIQVVRIIMAYVERKLKKRVGGGVFGFLLKCCQCCLWCFEKCMKFLNRNAYIEVAIYGYNFCKAAKKAFTLLTSNMLRVAAINSVGTFVLFLGKATVVASTVLIGMQIIQTQEEVVTNQWAPIALSAIFSYMIVDCFIGVYGVSTMHQNDPNLVNLFLQLPKFKVVFKCIFVDLQMAIDTIFLCFCEDSERNDGITKPYYMSVGLMVMWTELLQNVRIFLIDLIFIF